MKKPLSILTLTMVFLLAFSALAQDKVVIIPMGKSDPNLVPENIKADVTILSVTGTFKCDNNDMIAITQTCYAVCTTTHGNVGDIKAGCDSGCDKYELLLKNSLCTN